jgi:tetratricopeptide (TPR) repeat protein
MRRTILIFAILGAALFQEVQAQEEEQMLQEVNRDDLGNVSDHFQENFFEALKQKGIENYEKAISALETCKKLQPDNAVVFFEIGKNYRAMEQYEKAVENFSIAHELEPGREAILAELYSTYMEVQDYAAAASAIKKLVKIDNSYTEDLANVYMLNQQYDEALAVLDDLDSNFGNSSYRERIRRQIYALTNNTVAQIDNLEEGIAADPENEQNYLNLIYVHSQEGNEEEAYKIAQELLETNPGSTLVHLALYKFYLDREKPKEAVNSMKIVFRSEEIDADSKYKVLNDFLLFSRQNPDYGEELMEVAELLSELEEKPELYQELGQYFLRNNRKKEALEYFQKGLSQDSNNFELTKNTLLLQLEFREMELANKLSATALEIFPAQPVFYLLRGLTLNALENYQQAEEILTFGLDYVIDDRRMEADLYGQLAIANAGLNKVEKAEEFSRKAEMLMKEIN